MRIHLTQNLAITENTISSICADPFARTTAKIKERSRKLAAKKFAQHHRMVLTLQTLPDDIYKLIPKSEYLLTIDKAGSKLSIEMGIELPTIIGLIGGNYASSSTPLALLEDVIACHPRAEKEWRESEPITERGKKFAELVVDYLNRAMFTTPTQIAWSAPELTSCILHIAGRGDGRGRRRTGREIFLARLNERRYIDRSSMRRPKNTLTMPDSLIPYIGEAKLLHTALNK